MRVTDKATGEATLREVTITKDEGNRPETTLEGLAALPPVRGPGAVVTAGNASQLSDGPSAAVLREAGEADRKSVVEGKGVSERVDPGGGRGIKKKKTAEM